MPEEQTTDSVPAPDPVLLQHRQQQLKNISALIETVQFELQNVIHDNTTLNKRKEDLERELNTYDMRLQSILKEKELLFSRLMTVERDICKMGG